VPVLGGQVSERDRQMRLADAGGTEKDDLLGTLDKRQAGELSAVRLTREIASSATPAPIRR
jgi:hypothetical protein